MEKVGSTRTQNPAFCFISSGLKSLATQAQGLIKSSPLTFISQRASGIPNQVTVMVGGLGSRAQAAFFETAHSISKAIFGEVKAPKETKMTDKEFRLALIGQINPKEEGVFRVNPAEADVVKVAKDKSFEGKLPTHVAAIALKRSFESDPLFENDTALKKLQSHNPPLVDDDWNVTGDPKVVYAALTEGLSSDQKETFDQFLGLTSELNKHQETSKMHYSNTAVAVGTTVFARSKEKQDQLDIMMASGKYTDNFLSSLLETLDPAKAAEATQAPVVSEEPSASIPVLEEDLGLVRLEATPEAGRVFTDEGLKARIASLEAKENKSLKEIEPDKVYAALTEGLSGENKALFDGAVESLRGEAKSKEVNGKQPYEEMKALDAQLPRMSLVVQLIQTESIQNTPLGISDRSVEAFVTNKTLVDKLLRAGS